MFYLLSQLDAGTGFDEDKEDSDSVKGKEELLDEDQKKPSVPSLLDLNFSVKG